MEQNGQLLGLWGASALANWNYVKGGGGRGTYVQNIKLEKGELKESINKKGRNYINS